VARAIRLDGTCSGEHGIGMHKMDFLMQEAGLPAVELMRAIKRVFDPQNILNPGKVLWGADEPGTPRRSWAPDATVDNGSNGYS
jgi:D-lactate dehydrogenase (cytochrome)